MKIGIGNQKISHINKENKLRLNLKGKKDRIVPLSSKILEMLRHYYSSFKPKKYLFEGTIPGEPY